MIYETVICIKGISIMKTINLFTISILDNKPNQLYVLIKYSIIDLVRNIMNLVYNELDSPY